MIEQQIPVHHLSVQSLVDVVELVSQGLTNREIALQLHISRDAVTQVLKRMFQKLDVSARTAMVAKLKIS
ncbi:helix-turn-helix domain-containing protein [Leptothoe kymatousa]|uniref:Helix-turn-helix transcriptional regulator n=1 Tax=Leptothoe kymatousa TAU-MAC 1615 TaxID=2364775 RepID=A0ABS5Y5U5_9CYAN|nr:helix-turn-helix transcriptional regulator [Leptothoe kymatousa]MBT9313218.1 helix-turn-helix transcriptional regulator [Leptothoe kymatousa TAU-MAC 1615]